MRAAEERGFETKEIRLRLAEAYGAAAVLEVCRSGSKGCAVRGGGRGPQGVVAGADKASLCVCFESESSS